MCWRSRKEASRRWLSGCIGARVKARQGERDRCWPMTSMRDGWLCGEPSRAAVMTCRSGSASGRRWPISRLAAAREDLDDDHAAAAARAGARQHAWLVGWRRPAALRAQRRAGQHRAARGRVRCWRRDCRWRTGRSGGCGGSPWAARGIRKRRMNSCGCERHRLPAFGAVDA